MADTLTDAQRKFYDQQLSSVGSGAAAAAGKIGVANTGKLTVAAAGNFRVTFTNDSASPISVLRLTGMATVTSFTTLFLNPTAGLPAAIKRTNNAILASAAPAGVVRADTDAVTALSGGTDLGIAIGFGANKRETIDFPPVVIAAGAVLGLNVNVAGGSDAAFSLLWKVA